MKVQTEKNELVLKVKVETIEDTVNSKVIGSVNNDV